MMLKKLQWDSEFFGLSVYNLENTFSAKNFPALPLEKCFIQCLLPDEAEAQKKILHQNNFSMAAQRVELTCLIHAKSDGDSKISLQTFKNCINDYLKIPKGYFSDSRYLTGHYFLPEKVDQFYQQWLDNAFLSKFDHECHLLMDQKNIIGFCTIKYSGDKNAQIGLFGIMPAFQGKGLAQTMLNKIQLYVQQQGVEKLRVVTQGHNQAALKAYQRNGFNISNTSSWFHRYQEASK